MYIYIHVYIYLYIYTYVYTYIHIRERERERERERGREGESALVPCRRVQPYNFLKPWQHLQRLLCYSKTPGIRNGVDVAGGEAVNCRDP